MKTTPFVPTKGSPQPLLLSPNDTLLNAIRAKSLAYRDGYELYDRVVAEMTVRYGLDMDAILSLGEAAGKCSTALRFLDDGIPSDYILAMGEER